MRRPAIFAASRFLPLALRENELRIALRGGAASWSMILRGIIAFRDNGVVGKALKGFAIEDMGSFRAIRFLRGSGGGGPLLHCEYLEGVILPE